MLSRPSTSSPLKSATPLSAVNFDQQLNAGIQLIQSAFNGKFNALQDELAHWKQLSASQKQQITNLEIALSSTNKKLQELESKNEKLSSDYTELQRSASQLEAFRNSIVSMVNLGPQDAEPFPNTKNLVDATMDSFFIAQSANNSFIQPPLHLESSKSSRETLPMDAPTVYRQIRDILSPSDFEKFASVIAAFNNSQMPAPEAIAKVREIVKDEALCIQMEVLIKSALE